MNDPDNIRRLGIGCMAILFLLMCAMYALPMLFPGSFTVTVEEDDEYSAAESSLGPDTVTGEDPEQTKRLRELHKAGKFDEGIAACRELLKGSPAEARSAERELPNLLIRAFNDHQNAKRFEQARAVLEAARGFEKDAAKTASPEWPRRSKEVVAMLAEQWVRSVQERVSYLTRNSERPADPAELEKLVAELAAFAPEKVPFEALCQAKASRWKDAHDAGKKEEAEKLLREAAEAAAGIERLDTYQCARDSALEQALAEKIGGDELLAAGGHCLDKKAFALAFAYLSAAHLSLNKAGMPDTHDLQIKRARALLGLAREAAEGQQPWLKLDPERETLERLVEAAIHAQTFVARQGREQPPEAYAVPEEAWALKWSLLQRRAAELKKNPKQLHRAEQVCLRAMTHEAAAYLKFRAERMQIDPWPDVPEAARKDIEAKAKDPRDRLVYLEQAVRTRAFVPRLPGLEIFRDRYFDARAELAIAQAGSDPGRLGGVLPRFHEILHEAPESAAARRVRAWLQQAIRNAKGQKDFNALYELASVYMGTLGKDGAAPESREELADCLQTAADHYRDESPMKRAFMLSLLADLLRNDPRGKAAGDLAFDVGFKAVLQMPMQKPRVPDVLLPSPLPGHSIVAIENATGYHLLLFYDGPEKFFVRFNPYRKGLVGLKDGPYTLAVVVTDDSVRPYKGSFTYETKWVETRYQIVKDGQRDGGSAWTPSSGEWETVRMPPGMQSFKVVPGKP
ncbi:MAG: hypothetical protein L6R28_13760 [Planctomycetes bacterium]|nr:hypothetical protein [Planctomycetota bacterium]